MAAELGACVVPDGIGGRHHRVGGVLVRQVCPEAFYLHQSVAVQILAGQRVGFGNNAEQRVLLTSLCGDGKDARVRIGVYLLQASHECLSLCAVRCQYLQVFLHAGQVGDDGRHREELAFGGFHAGGDGVVGVGVDAFAVEHHGAAVGGRAAFLRTDVTKGELLLQLPSVGLGEGQQSLVFCVRDGCVSGSIDAERQAPIQQL